MTQREIGRLFLALLARFPEPPAGFATSYLVNRWLIRKGIKEKM